MSKRSKRNKKRERQKTATIKPYRTFRFFHPANHPAVIIKSSETEAEGYIVSHAKGEERKKAIRLAENPEYIVSGGKHIRKADPSYLHLQKRTGEIGHEFSKEILPLFRLCDADERLIDKILRAKSEGLPYLTYFDDSETARISPPQKARKKEK